MKTYWVYCEIFGKKFKAKQRAMNEAEAMIKVKERMRIHKCEEEENDGLNMLKNIFGI